MDVAGRCDVETWAELGFAGISCTPKIKFSGETDVFLCIGCDEVYVFSAKERKLTAVLQFPDSVSDLVQSYDKQLLYVACRSGVYSISLQFLLSRAQSSQADVSSSSVCELQISSKFLVVSEKGTLSLLLVGSVLLTLSLKDTSCILTLYRSHNQLASSSYEMLTSFCVPLVSVVAHVVTKGNKGKIRRPVLICVHSGDTTTPPPSSPTSLSERATDSHFCLEPVLFKLLFGVDAALAKSPVVLCGLPDGCLYFLPLHLPGSRLRVLHSLEQPVVFVGASCVAETGPGHAQCLVAVGEHGRVVIIKTKKGEPEGAGVTAGFIERCVPGPVMCGCIDENCLYYSIGSDFLRLDLSAELLGKEGQENEDKSSTKTDAALQSPTSLNVCRVVALAEPTSNTAGEVQLLGLSLRGQLQRITVPMRSEDAGLYKGPSAQMGRSVRDLLSAIGDVCERASVLKTAIKSKNQILKHLNQVLNISFLLNASTKADEHLHIQEKPIKCRAAIEWSRLLQKDSLNLTCVLDNSSPYALELGWTLSITVLPLSCSPSEGGENSSTNFSFPFNNIHPGETLEVLLPLAPAGDSSFPVTVSCSLMFSLSSLLGKEAANLPGSQSSCISLPLNTLTVDWLHALQVRSPIAAQKKAIPQCKNTTMDTLQPFLSSRWTGCSGRKESGESTSKPDPEQYSASVRVSSELLRNTLGLTGLEPQEQNLAPLNMCFSLLEWLLFEEHGGVRTGHRGDVSSSVVHAQGPNGHAVQLTAKEMNVGEESAVKESLNTVVLQVQSSSIAAVCGLHHAVLCRVQTLLQRAPERAASTTSVQSLGLRQAVQRVEHLLQQIRQSRVSRAIGVGASTGQMTRCLLSIYRELRENPLIIV